MDKAIESFIDFCENMKIVNEALTSSSNIKALITKIKNDLDNVISKKYKNVNGIYVTLNGIDNDTMYNEVFKMNTYFYASCIFQILIPDYKKAYKIREDIYNYIIKKYGNQSLIVIEKTEIPITTDYDTPSGHIKKGTPIYYISISDSLIKSDEFKKYSEDVKNAMASFRKSTELQNKYFRYILSDYAKRYHYNYIYDIFGENMKFNGSSNYNISLYTSREGINPSNEEYYLKTAYNMLKLADKQFKSDKNEIIDKMVNYINDWISEDGNGTRDLSDVLSAIKYDMSILIKVNAKGEATKYDQDYVSLSFPCDLIDGDHNLHVDFIFENGKYKEWNMIIEG